MIMDSALGIQSPADLELGERIRNKGILAAIPIRFVVNNGNASEAAGKPGRHCWLVVRSMKRTRFPIAVH